NGRVQAFTSQDVAQLYAPDNPLEVLSRAEKVELLKRIDVPYRVVINEGIELAKVYGSTDGHKFVNGVLDKLAPRLREVEVKAHKR
ncbi:N utilization substance protein B -like protein, partial [Pseudomonas syringae pv. maculicola]